MDGMTVVAVDGVEALVSFAFAELPSAAATAASSFDSRGAGAVVVGSCGWPAVPGARLFATNAYLHNTMNEITNSNQTHTHRCKNPGGRVILECDHHEFGVQLPLGRVLHHSLLLRPHAGGGAGHGCKESTE